MNVENLKDVPLTVLILSIIIGPLLSALVGVISSWLQFKKSKKTDDAEADVKVSDAALRIVKELQAQSEIQRQETATLRSEVKEMGTRMDQLQQENSELKAESERLTTENDRLKIRVSELELENERLKREVQELKNGGKGC